MQDECDLQAARTDRVSTRHSDSSPSRNGTSLSEDPPLQNRFSSNGSKGSNGSSPNSVVTGTDLQERPYSNNGNGASLDSKASSYAQQGSPAQRRETAVADALQDAASDEQAQQDPGPSQPQQKQSSRSAYTESDIASQSSAAQQQQDAAVQDALQSPRAKASGSSRWSRVGKYSTLQVRCQCRPAHLSFTPLVATHCLSSCSPDHSTMFTVCVCEHYFT